MADPIVEQIAQAVKGKLDALVTATTLSEAQRPRRVGLPSSPQDRSVALLQSSPVLANEQLQGYLSWVQPFEVYCFVRPGDASTDAADTLVNALRSDVEKKLIEDIASDSPVFGGLADNVQIGEPTYFQIGEAIAGIIVRIDVLYRTRETDPYAQ